MAIYNSSKFILIWALSQRKPCTISSVASPLLGETTLLWVESSISRSSNSSGFESQSCVVFITLEYLRTRHFFLILFVTSLNIISRAQLSIHLQHSFPEISSPLTFLRGTSMMSVFCHSFMLTNR